MTTMLKMYFLVLYNLSPIQQGIQAGHCAVEYIKDHGFTYQDPTILQEIDSWMKFHKTFIILNGGTTETMKQHLKYLVQQKVRVSYFSEPDLDNLMTCMCFLAEDGSEVTKYFTPLFKLA